MLMEHRYVMAISIMLLILRIFFKLLKLHIQRYLLLIMT